MFTVCGYTQSANNPVVERKSVSNINIKSVVTNSYTTTIHFVYTNTENKGRYILLHPPGHPDAYYLIANGKKYRLVGTQNIATVDRITSVMPGKKIEFSASFEKLPGNVSKFDLIEGIKGDWDFYGVRVDETYEPPQAKKFRKDYNYIALYDPDTDTWGSWERGDNVFVINVNDKGDIAHLKANGETVIYKRLSGVEEDQTSNGDHYQIISALDENGDVFRFQLFDDQRIGLKMMWGAFIIQFSNH